MATAVETMGWTATANPDPDCIHVSSIYVKRLILGAPNDKKIEFVTRRERAAA